MSQFTDLLKEEAQAVFDAEIAAKKKAKNQNKKRRADAKKKTKKAKK